MKLDFFMDQNSVTVSGMFICSGLRNTEVRPLRQMTKPPKSRLADEVTRGWLVVGLARIADTAADDETRARRLDDSLRVELVNEVSALECPLFGSDDTGLGDFI
jgi:hypothetical protein